MKTMKKVAAMFLAVMMIASLCACSSKANFNSNFNQSSTQTYNGISMIETTSTVNGETQTTVEYKDADGNVLDPDIGAKAFEAAKNGDQHALETVMAAHVTDEPTKAAAQEEAITGATITFENETGVDFSELYFAMHSSDSWGTNLLSDSLESGKALTFHEALTYTPTMLFDMKVVTPDGHSITFESFDFSGAGETYNITLTFTEADGAYNMHIA